MSAEVYTDPFIVPKSILLYPSLYREIAIIDGDPVNPHLSAIFVFDNKEDLKPIMDRASNITNQKWGDKTPQDFNLPWGKCEDKYKIEELEGKYYLKAKLNTTTHKGTKSKLKVIDRYKNDIPIEREDEIYGGVIVDACVTMGTYTKGKNCGIIVYLKSVRKLEEGDRIGGSGDGLSLYEDYEEEPLITENEEVSSNEDDIALKFVEI